MSENINTAVIANENNQEITVKYILEQIEKIHADSKYIYEALEKLEGVTTSSSADIGAQAKAQGIETVVQCRETTNQQMLKFYEKIYNDLYQENKKSAEAEQKIKDQSEKIELIKKAFDQNMSFINDSDLKTEDKFAALGYVTDKIAELVKTVIVQAEPQTEAQTKRREEFLEFVSRTVIAAEPGVDLPDFEKLWKAVYLGQ